MNDTQLTAILVGLTSLLRSRFPKIDGLIVPGVAIVLGAGLSAAGDPEHWRDALVHGIGLALTAVGGMSALSYVGAKVGEGIGAATGATAASAGSEPPTEPPPTAPATPSALAAERAQEDVSAIPAVA